MKDAIREYFKQMLEEGFDIESAKDNLIDLVIEISYELESEGDE